MRSVGIMLSLALMASAVSAQTPPTQPRDDLDVTMRVIVDPNAKVPDEIVHRISLPKPAQPASGTAPQSDNPDKSDKSDKSGKPTEPGAKGKDHAPDAQQQGREFGQQTAEEARQHAEDARKNKENKPNHRGPPTAGRPPMGPPPKPGDCPRRGNRISLRTHDLRRHARAAQADAAADEARVAFEAQGFFHCADVVRAGPGAGAGWAGGSLQYWCRGVSRRRSRSCRARSRWRAPRRWPRSPTTTSDWSGWNAEPKRPGLLNEVRRATSALPASLPASRRTTALPADRMVAVCARRRGFDATSALELARQLRQRRRRRLRRILLSASSSSAATGVSMPPPRC